MESSDFSHPLQVSEARLRAWTAGSSGRLDFWVAFVNGTQAREVAEIGVYRGAFADRLLRDCPGISTYYMIDPWRHLDDWNKPANRSSDVFERFFQESMEKTEAWAEKRVVLRGRTSEVIEQVPEGGLDFAYIDGDHTLRGITVDLVKVFSKVRDGGWIGGDDFRPSIWQHEDAYEPTLVFPYAVCFAEAVDARIYGLPYNQFLIEKTGNGHEFVDLTGRYGGIELRSQLLREDARPLTSMRARVRRRLRL